MIGNWPTRLGVGMISLAGFFFLGYKYLKVSKLLRMVKNNEQISVLEVIRNRSKIPKNKIILVYGLIDSDSKISGLGNIQNSSIFSVRHSHSYYGGSFSSSQPFQHFIHFVREYYIKDSLYPKKKILMASGVVNFLPNIARKVHENIKMDNHSSFRKVLQKIINFPLIVFNDLFSFSLSGIQVGVLEKEFVVSAGTPLLFFAKFHYNEGSSSMIEPVEYVATSLIQLKSSLGQRKSWLLAGMGVSLVGVALLTKFCWKSLIDKFVEMRRRHDLNRDFALYKKTVEKIEFDLTCIVCNSYFKNVVILPCRHCCICNYCYYQYYVNSDKKKCLYCKETVKNKINLEYH